MLNVQNWLLQNNSNYALLEQQLGIKATHHEDGRVILNYSQIDSDKHNPIVQECRGLVLNSHYPDHLVARAFPRFFNYGEMKDRERNFVWEGCKTYHKEDGSLILTYRWNGDYHLNTRASFGNGEVVQGVITWRQLFEQAVPNWKNRQQFADYGGELAGVTLVWELCSKYNKVVRDYPTPTAYLLTAFTGETEWTDEVVDSLAAKLGVLRPAKTTCLDICDTQAYIAKIVENDMTFEGVVVRDCNNLRFKIKSPFYLQLHKTINNHELTKDRIIKILLEIGLDEFCLFFPEIKSKLDDLYQQMLEITEEIKQIWPKICNIQSQKDFALSINHLKFKSILFTARKLGKHPLDCIDEKFWVSIL